MATALYRMTSSHPGLIISSSKQVALDPSVHVDFQVAAAAAQRILSGSVEDLCTRVREALTRDLLPG